MPDCVMRRIHVHWTVGTYTANSVDKAAYHILVQGDGSFIRGDKSIDANAAGSGKTPASHTKGANTGAIGLSICAMAGARESPYVSGAYPITELQWRRMIEAAAHLSVRYEIAVTPTTILTHAEVQPSLGIPQNGKWDITRLGFAPSKVGPKAVGDKMRVEVAVVRDGIVPKALATDMPLEMKLPRLRVRGVAPSTLTFRRSPNGEKVGELLEGTRVEMVSRSGDWLQVRTPSGYIGWVATAYTSPFGPF
jgi:hypothetical protein